MKNPFEEIISELKTVRQENADLKALLIGAQKKSDEVKALILALKPIDDELLTPKEVCAYLGINLSTRWRYEKDGKIKSERIGGKILYRKSDLENCLKN